MDDLRALLRRLSFGLWHKRWIALAVAWVLCIAGWIGVASIPNQYEASARLFVDSDAVLTPLLRGLALDNTPTNQLDVLQHTLLSRPNLEKLISKTDLELTIAGPTDLERVVFTLANQIKLTPQTRNLFTISYRSTSPKLAYDVVQAMLTIFIESKTGTNRADMENARRFLEQQLTQYEQKLRLVEAKRTEFRQKYIDLLPSDVAGMNGTTRLDALREQGNILAGRLKDAEEARGQLKVQLDSTPETYAGADIVAGGGGIPGLAEAQRRLAELRLKYTDQHPDVIAARQQIEALKASGGGGDGPRVVTGHTRGAANPVHEQLKLKLIDNESLITSLKRQIDDVAKERDRLETLARTTPGLMAEYTDINRDYDVLRKNHEELLARRESMHIASAADTDAEKVKLDVIDPPQLPRIPVSPKRVLLDTGVLGLGIAGGIGFALMLMQFDSSFQTVDELLKFDLPVAGSISMIAAAVPLRRRILGLGSFAVAMLLLCVVWGGLVYKMIHNGVA